MKSWTPLCSVADPLTTSGIDALLSNLKIHKATGPDGISARVLKEMHSSIAPILKVIFDCCLNTGVVTNDWKIANVTPLFKKGDRLQTSNYRPISLTSIILKIFEHILCSNIMKHLKQMGFSITANMDFGTITPVRPS